MSLALSINVEVRFVVPHHIVRVLMVVAGCRRDVSVFLR